MIPAYLPVPGFGVLPANAFVIHAQEPVLGPSRRGRAVPPVSPAHPRLRTAPPPHADTATGELREDEPNHSFRNILRAGFRETGLIDNFAPPGTAWP